MNSPLEQRITKLLEKEATEKQIQKYLDDIFNFSDIKLYEEADDETILFDFKDWLGN